MRTRQRIEAGAKSLKGVIAGLDPAIHLLKRWMPGPSPRRSGFGRAGGSSPGMTVCDWIVIRCKLTIRFERQRGAPRWLMA